MNGMKFTQMARFVNKTARHRRAESSKSSLMNLIRAALYSV